MVEIVKDKSKVSVNYTGTLDDGTVFDTSEGREPITFVVGEHQVIKGFEDGVLGMKLNEEKTIHIPKEEAYGPRIEQLMQKVPKDKFPSNIPLKKGIVLSIKDPHGHTFNAAIADIDDSSITLDLNHPLAGKDLNFKLKVVKIE